jgi:hypothetical protein
MAADVTPVLSPAEMSSAIRDLTLAVSNLRTFLQTPYAPPPPPPPPAAPFTPPSTIAPKGLLITQIRFPSLLSPLPMWIDPPTYTTAPPQPTVLQPPATTFGGFGGYTNPSIGSSMVPQYSPVATMGRHEGAYIASPHVQQPPRFIKLEFATYDGTVDPLNWLNQCDQFFWGQRTDTSQTYLLFLMLHACFCTICLVVCYTSWRFYAISGTNLLTRCHSASSLFSAVFVFQTSYTGNILRIG